MHATVEIQSDVAERWDQFTDEEKRSLLKDIFWNVPNLNILRIEQGTSDNRLSGRARPRQ